MLNYRSNEFVALTNLCETGPRATLQLTLRRGARLSIRRPWKPVLEIQRRWTLKCSTLSMPSRSATKADIIYVKKHSFMCQGGKFKNWLAKSYRLSKTFSIQPNGGDMRILDECINYRLGNDMLRKMKYLQNTQKLESVNQTISAHNPEMLHFRGKLRDESTRPYNVWMKAQVNPFCCPVRLLVPPNIRV